jgi:uncharacterized RDD family membrane protein YckC
MADVDPTAATLSESGQTGPRSAETGSPAPGTLFAHFRLDAPVGQGGMGQVWRATDMALDRPVAIKLLPPAVARDPEHRARFYREARAQARLNHPNICHIYYIGEREDQLFFAMELVEGESLQQRLERLGKIPLGEAVEYCRMAALGLREAHARGFTHRDIKPSNLMLDRHGVIKLVDFGLVKKTEGGDVAQTGGVLVGTPLYMSPEQARGDAVDFRSDIYSLGVTLHTLIAGEPPFSGPTALAVVSKHLSDPRPRLLKRSRGAVTLLDELIDRMMAKKPADRFGSYDELVAALERLSPHVTRPAGFWVRAFAVALDFLVVGLLTIPLTLLRQRLHLPKVDFLPLVGAAYSIFFHARTGRTPGKRALEIETVTRDGRARLGFRRATLRFLVQWAPTLFAVYAAAFLPHFGDPRWREPFEIALVILACAIPLLLGTTRSPIWDRAANTQVVYRRLAAAA